MPLRDIVEMSDKARIVTWDVLDDLDFMRSKIELSPERLTKYNSLTSKRKKEYLGLRLCLLELGVNQDVLYDKKGKPYLESDHHISITHSHEKVSVGMSESKIGVDIELNRPKKIENIRKKFIREDEESWLSKKTPQNDYLHIIWGLKEGLYKLNGGNLWNFLHHYKVSDFPLDFSPIKCWISDESSSRSYVARYKIIDDYYLTWVLDIDA